MILNDFSGIIFATLHVDIKDGQQPSKDYIRAMTLNTLRAYNMQFKHKYGEMVLCFDSRSWREVLLKEYKWVRKNGREIDKNVDWDVIWDIFTEIREELKNRMPYRVVEALGAEGDDIIAVLSKQCLNEPVLIISNDKDMVALTGQENVSQFRPFTKKMFECDDPARWVFDLIIAGDKADGIPSIKCPDDFYKKQWLANDAFKKDPTLTKGPNAPPISKKWKEILWEAYSTDSEAFKKELGEYSDNYIRNLNLIDLNFIPDMVVSNINIAYNNSVTNSEMKMLDYFKEHRLQLLAKCATDFRPNKINQTLF